MTSLPDATLTLKSLKEKYHLQPFGTSLQKLQKNLPGFNNEAEVSAWLSGPLFQPHWQELVTAWLKPKYDAAESAGTKCLRGLNFATILQIIVDGEDRGQRRFSRPLKDKTGWSEEDHVAQLIFSVVKENLEDREELLSK